MSSRPDLLDPARVQVIPQRDMHGRWVKVLLDDEPIGHLDEVEPGRWRGELVISMLPVQLAGPHGGKALHGAVSDMIAGLQA